MSREDASFSIHVQIVTQRDLSSNPYVQQLELEVFELESSLEREQMDKDKWKKFYKEKDEEVDRLRLDIDKAKKVLLPADSMLKQPMGGMAAMTTETGTGISAEDWIKKPVKPYRPIISKEDADYLGTFWEHRQAAASTRTGAQNNILDPVQVLHQLVFDEIDNTVIGATQLSNATADVIRNDATLYTRTYLDAMKSIKNQTGVCKTTYLPNILCKLEEDYSSVLCLGKTDWKACIFVTGVLRNRSGSAYNYDDEDDLADDQDGGRIAKRGMKRKVSIDVSVVLPERRNGVERLHADHGEHLSLLGHKWGQRGPGLEESSASIGTVARVVEQTMSRKRYRPMANLPNDPLREKRVRQNKLLKNQNSSVSMPDSIKVSIGAYFISIVADNDCLVNIRVLAAFIEDGETLAQSATKRLLIAVTSAECDINLPIDADDDKYSSKDLRNNPQGNMLGHNSLGEETLFCLKKWENVGSREAIWKLLQAMGGWPRVWLRLGWREVVATLFLILTLGKDVRSAKALKNSMVPGEYSKSLHEKSQHRTDPLVGTTSTLEAEEHLIPPPPFRSTAHCLPPNSPCILEIAPPLEQNRHFTLALQQGHDNAIPPPTENQLPPPPLQEHGLVPMPPFSEDPCNPYPPNSNGIPSGPIEPSDIRPAPLKLRRGGQTNAVGASKKRGKSKKSKEDPGALPPEEVMKLREDVEKLRPLLDKQDAITQLVEAKKLVKDNRWNAEHWKKMLQNQVDQGNQRGLASGSGGGSDAAVLKSKTSQQREELVSAKNLAKFQGNPHHVKTLKRTKFHNQLDWTTEQNRDAHPNTPTVTNSNSPSLLTSPPLSLLLATPLFSSSSPLPHRRPKSIHMNQIHVAASMHFSKTSTPFIGALLLDLRCIQRRMRKISFETDSLFAERGAFSSRSGKLTLFTTTFVPKLAVSFNAKGRSALEGDPWMVREVGRNWGMREQRTVGSCRREAQVRPEYEGRRRGWRNWKGKGGRWMTRRNKRWSKREIDANEAANGVMVHGKRRGRSSGHPCHLSAPTSPLPSVSPPRVTSPPQSISYGQVGRRCRIGNGWSASKV
ncbi:hypothetical protein BT69DRAFT_1298618 [Atractiella rhizophila]|nr:hypothetical protein BT69DRAFT_1298618 [Atractiella rhizophila]